MKYCYSCKTNRPLSDFNKNKRNKDGYATECRDCKRIYLEQYRKLNKEALTEKSRKFKEEHRDEINSKNRKRYYLKKDNKLFLERKHLHAKKYKANNKGCVNANTVKRYTAKLHRTPLWMTDEELKQIKALYIEASRLTKETGISHHVDHIIPLQGELVSGLHTINNLQILTEKENCSKHNIFVV